MTKWFVQFRTGDKEEIEADGVQETNDGKGYRFYRREPKEGKSNTAALIPVEVVTFVKKIED